MFNITLKFFSIFNNKPPAGLVTHIARDFLACFSCLYYSSMVYCLFLIFKKIFRELWYSMVYKLCLDNRCFAQAFHMKRDAAFMGIVEAIKKALFFS